MTTLSRLHHIAACPGSATLPAIARANGRADLGTAIHGLAQHMVEGYEGPQLLVDDLAAFHGLAPDDAGRLAFLAEHLRLPVPAGALAEVALGYFPDGTVRRIEGGAGAYPDVGQALSGTLDCMWAEPGTIREYGHAWLEPADATLWLVDWKTGDEDHVPPVDRNWQLRAGAVMAARWTGARRVIPAICYVNAAECAEAVRAGRVYEGRWEVGAPLDAPALDAIEVEMCAVLARASHDPSTGSDVRIVLGGPPLILGPHCEHCPARGACPALAAEALSIARAAGWIEGGEHGTTTRGHHPEPGGLRGGGVGTGSGADLSVPPDADAVRVADGVGAREAPEASPWLVQTRGSGADAVLTPAAASRLAGLLGPARRVLDAVETAVQAHVRTHGPLVLADGREYGPALEPVTRWRTAPTFDALAEVVGEDAANEAAEFTSAGIKRALDAAGAPRGAFGRLRKDVEARGGVVLGAREVWRKRWPAKPEEVSDADHGDDGRGGLGRSGEPVASTEAVDAAQGQGAGVALPGGSAGAGEHNDQPRSGTADGDAAAEATRHGVTRDRAARPLPDDFGTKLGGRTLRLLEGLGYDAAGRAALVGRYRASVAGETRKAWRESWLHDFAVAERAAVAPGTQIKLVGS